MNNRLLTLRLQLKKYPSEKVERYIIYNGDKIDLSESQVDEILDMIPSVWHTEKDKLTYFVLMQDRTFICNKCKSSFNFSLRDVEDKQYFFDAVTKEQLDELVLILINFYNKIKLDKIDNFYTKIINSLSDLSYVKQRLITMREKALSETDYMFNSDYSFKSSSEEDEWKKYRQEWRDITEKDFWKNNDLLNIEIPRSPIPSKQLPFILSSISFDIQSTQISNQILNEFFTEEEYLSVLKNYGSLFFKIEILKTLSSLGLPIGVEITEVENTENIFKSSIQPIQELYKQFVTFEDEEKIVNFWKNKIKDIDQKIETINKEFEKYNMNFTINDILQKLIEDTQIKLKEKEINEQVNNLLTEIQFDGV